jgi:hypothetical protein
MKDRGMRTRHLLLVRCWSGPALVVGGTALSQVWLFIVAPLVGGVLAAGLHRLLYAGEDIQLAAEARQPDQLGDAGAS